MLLAVEGGGFFSSSATGYSKGLTLLLLGRRNEDKPMRVSPWNQYQLVEQETDPNLQLASGKRPISCGCAAFVCFGRASAGSEGPSHPKVTTGSIKQHDCLPERPVSDKTEDYSNHENDELGRNILKSSLKKGYDYPHVVPGDDLQKTLVEDDSDVTGCTGRRKVQWTDSCGKELYEIREFELSK
ncbi:hypothetical protein Sjap_010573 [Stephania japonica]|uniref:Uncharacterized protein n=1 Tax=Stephania japonica TaxID=461633 RepID=A0AAP0J9P1_9MAGN